MKVVCSVFSNFSNIKTLILFHSTPKTTCKIQHEYFMALHVATWKNLHIMNRWGTVKQCDQIC